MYSVNENKVLFCPQPPVFRQIAALIFGLVFAFTNGYSGLQLVGAAIGAPLIFAGAVRLYTAVYRLAHSLLPIGLVAAIAGFIGVGCVPSFLLAPAFQHSAALGDILTVALMICEVCIFWQDVKAWKQMYRA